MPNNSIVYPAVFWIPGNEKLTSPGGVKFQKGETITFEI